MKKLFVGNNFFLKKNRARVRNIIRGYIFLKKNKKLEEIKDIITSISFIKLSDETDEISLRQFLFEKIVSAIFFNQELLHHFGSNKPISFPLPPIWLEALKEKGLKVNKFESNLKLKFVAVKYLFRGINIFLNIFISNLFNIILRIDHPRNHSFFFGLNKENLTLNNDYTKEENTLNWFIKSNIVSRNEIILHDIDLPKNRPSFNKLIKYASHVNPPIKKYNYLFKFFFSGFNLIFKALGNLLLGKLHLPILLGDYIDDLSFKFSDRKYIAKNYFFNNSMWIYRPIWTYEAEKKGSNVTFYFYSTNIEPFKRKNSHKIDYNYWHLSTWSKYLVWDQYQKEFIQNENKFAKNISLVGPIWMNDTEKIIPELPKKSIAIFDIMPLRSSEFQMLMLNEEYYTANVVNSFLKDIVAILSEHNISIVIKQKRIVNKNRLHKNYNMCLDNLSKNKNVIFVDPNIAATRLVKKCDALISFPFTSTALLGEYMLKPSIYYDPINYVMKDDRGAHGVSIISGKEELGRWIKSIYN